MSEHHCCNPAHRDLEERLRRMRKRCQDAESRMRWAEANESVMADAIGRMRDRLEALGQSVD